jgi:hypothetical protein
MLERSVPLVNPAMMPGSYWRASIEDEWILRSFTGTFKRVSQLQPIAFMR